MKDQFQANYPFISCIKSSDREYVGIVINWDQSVASIYDLSMIIDEDQRKHFLSLGEIWWWESNRKIPINIFLKGEMKIYRSYIKSFNAKDISLIFGPTVNLNDIAEKRVKRKSIQLIRSIKKNHS